MPDRFEPHDSLPEALEPIVIVGMRRVRSVRIVRLVHVSDGRERAHGPRVPAGRVGA